MKLRQKIASLFVAAVTAFSALSVTAFATDPVGSGNVIELKDGVEAAEIIKYVDGVTDFDDGHNYVDFRYTAPADGVLVINCDAMINNSNIVVYQDSNKKEIEPFSRDFASGNYSGVRAQYGYWAYSYNEASGFMSVVNSYNVEKGDYIIRVSRWFNWGAGKEGNGRIHITAEMKKPDVPADIKVSAKTDTTVSLTWAEPDGADAYDIRYKASNAKSWTTVEDIKDNKATISKLKAATKYSYCIRSKAGEIVGEWSKAATVTTSDPKNVKIAAPTVNNAKLTAEISWKAVKNATGYNVKYSTDKKNWTTVKVTETSCYIPVTAGKTYYYAVQGRNSAKTGSWSATKSIKIG